MPVDGHPVDGIPTLGRAPAAPRHPRDADALYAAAETETAAAERLTAELVDSDARASSSARAARPGETHALLPRRAYDDPRDERRKPHDRPLRLGAADLAESAILRAMLRDGKYEEMLEFARRVEPPTDPTDGGDGGGDVPLGNRALAEADATATAARRAVVATAREHLGDDAKANEAADVVERAAERAAVAAMTSAGLLRTDRGEDPRGDVGESAALVDPSSVLADALRRFGDDADAAVAAAAAAESRATAEAFRARALGDAAAAEARALAADRARLLEIIDAERGAYPLAANPAAASEAAEKEAREGASKKASEAAFWGDAGWTTTKERGKRRRRNATRASARNARRRRRRRVAARATSDSPNSSDGRDPGWTSRRTTRRTKAGRTRTATANKVADADAAPTPGIRRRSCWRFARASPPRWRIRNRAWRRTRFSRRAGAPKEAPNGASSETSKEEAHAASKEEAWLCRLRAAAPRNTRGRRRGARARRRRSAGRRRRSAGRRRRSAGQWSTTSNPQDRRRSRERRKRRRRRRRPERSRRPDRHPRLRSSRHPLRRGRDRGTFQGVSSRRIVSRRVVSEGVSASEPVGGGVGPRARETPREKTAPRETTSDGGRVRLGGRRPRAPRAPEGRAKTTSREDDETEGVEGDDVDPRVERIDRIERGGARERGSFSRRRSRRRRVASVPSFASDSDDSGEVSIPLRTALRVAAELPTALSPADAEKSPNARAGRATRPGGETVPVPRDRDAIANRDRVSPEDTAFEQALARREIRVREAHVRLRARTLGLVRAGAGAAEDDPIPGEAVAAAILSRGAAVPPIPFVDGTANADNADDVDSTTIARKRAGVSSLGLAYDPADEDARRAVERATRPASAATRASSTTGKEPSRNRPREMDEDELVAERRRERTRRIHDALRAKGRRAYSRGGRRRRRRRPPRDRDYRGTPLGRWPSVRLVSRRMGS